MFNPRKRNKTLLVSQIHSHCSECGVRACSVLKDCSAETLDKVSYVKKCFIYLKGQRILMEGVGSNGIYFINSGKVKIYKSGKGEKQLIIRFAKAGEMLGFGNDDDAKGQTVSAMALEDILVRYIENKHFLEIIGEYPEIAFKIL